MSGDQSAATIGNLPVDGSSVWVRLWYLLPTTNGPSWRYVDNEYTALSEGDVGVPVIANPAPDTQLNATSTTLEWNMDGTGPSAWWVYAGSSPGSANYHNSGALPVGTSTHDITGLPSDGSDVWVRLWYRQGVAGIWRHIAARYDAADDSPILSAENDGFGTEAAFSWTEPRNQTGPFDYWLWVGLERGTDDVYDSGNLGASDSYTVPVDVTEGVWVRLWYRGPDDRWKFVDNYFPNFGL